MCGLEWQSRIGSVMFGAVLYGWALIGTAVEDRLGVAGYVWARRDGKWQ